MWKNCLGPGADAVQPQLFPSRFQDIETRRTLVDTRAPKPFNTKGPAVCTRKAIRTKAAPDSPRTAGETRCSCFFTSHPFHHWLGHPPTSSSSVAGLKLRADNPDKRPEHAFLEHRPSYCGHPQRRKTPRAVTQSLERRLDDGGPYDKPRLRSYWTVLVLLYVHVSRFLSAGRRAYRASMISAQPACGCCTQVNLLRQRLRRAKGRDREGSWPRAGRPGWPVGF